MQPSQGQTPDPSNSSWSNPIRRLPETAGWMLLVNLFLGCIFFFELQWYLENIYRFDSGIPFISYDRVVTVIDLLWGAFMLHVGAPLARGRLEVLSHPEKVLGKEAVGLFCHRSTAVAAAGLVAGCYALISVSPALHLSHTFSDDAPVVRVDGNRRDFEGSKITLLDWDMDAGQPEIRVAGKSNFYRVRIHPEEDAQGYWLFPTHKWVNLDRFFLRGDLVTRLRDAHGRELASFTFEYQSDSSLGDQCAASDLQKQFPEDPQACVNLLRNIMAKMSGDPEARLLRDSKGDIEHGGRLYRYSYTAGSDLGLVITAPEAQSEFANYPGAALGKFRSVGPDERALLVSEFGKDVGSLSSSALEGVFKDLFESAGLTGYLRGTTSQKTDALQFARDVLAHGTDHVPGEAVNDLVDRILKANFAPYSSESVFVPAIDALLALSGRSSGLRSRVLEEVDVFVSSLGTGRNTAKPAIAGMLVQALGDDSNGPETERVAATLSTLRRSVEGVGHHVQLVDSQIRERIGQLSNGSVTDVLREVIEARDTAEDPSGGRSGDEP